MVKQDSPLVFLCVVKGDEVVSKDHDSNFQIIVVRDCAVSVTRVTLCGLKYSLTLLRFKSRNSVRPTLSVRRDVGMRGLTNAFRHKRQRSLQHPNLDCRGSFRYYRVRKLMSRQLQSSFQVNPQGPVIVKMVSNLYLVRYRKRKVTNLTDGLVEPKSTKRSIARPRQP